MSALSTSSPRIWTASIGVTIWREMPNWAELTMCRSLVLRPGSCSTILPMSSRSTYAGVPDQVAVFADSFEEGGKGFKIERLIKEAVADGEAFRDFETVGKSRDNDAGGFGIVPHDLIEELHAVHLRHGEVGDDDIE